MVSIVVKYNADCLPDDPDWLHHQSSIVLAVGSPVGNADVVVASEDEVASVIKGIDRAPRAAMALAKLLRKVDSLEDDEVLTRESLAYAELQGGIEHQRWLANRPKKPALLEGVGESIEIDRQENILYARLNRPDFRNAISVEIRDGLMLLFEIFEHDSSLQTMEIRAAGACFSVGGALQEFGLCQDYEQAHFIRTVHNPARKFAQFSEKITCHVHGACLGSGIELPAFAGSLVASKNAFFQLPELDLGLIPGAGGCLSISRRIGRQRTAWMVFTGKRVRAQQALSWGLIDAIE